MKKVRDREVVSFTMSRIRSTDTSIELALRRALWASGLRFRKNYRGVVGTPDVAFTRVRVAVFCDSSFCHGKDWERKKKRFTSNRSYWIAKIQGNIARDRRVNVDLKRQGWHLIRFWDSHIEERLDDCVDKVRAAVARRRGGAE